MSLLRLHQLEFGYAGKPCAKPFDFELAAGEVVALMGRNGCGKSTLLKTLAMRIAPLSGAVDSWPAAELAKHLTLVRMGLEAPERMTVREFVGLGRTPYAGIFDGRNAEDERIIDEALELLELKNFEGRLVTELSDGERSRVYLAEALAQQVDVMLLDEPNAFLDIPRSHQLFRTLRKLAADKKMGIIVSTHSVEYAERYCDRLMVIDAGEIRVGTFEQARQNGMLNWTEE